MNEIIVKTIAYLRRSDTFARYLAWWLGGLTAIVAVVLAIVWGFHFLDWLAGTQGGAIIIWFVIGMAVFLGPPGYAYYNDHIVGARDEGLDLEEEFGDSSTRSKLP